MGDATRGLQSLQVGDAPFTQSSTYIILIINEIYGIITRALTIFTQKAKRKI